MSRDGNGVWPTLVFLSVHKGASTFLARDLAPAICRECPGTEHVRVAWHHLRGTPLEDLALPAHGVVATRIYPDLFDRIIEDPEPEGGRFAGKRLILVRRDPRDAAVSLFFSKAYSHRPPPGRDTEFLRERERLQTLDPADGVLELAAREPIREFRGTVAFLRAHPETCVAPYELLVTDFPAWYTRVAAYAGWPEALAARIGAGLNETVAPPDEVDVYAHKRRVTPGNWREIFDDRLRDIFEREIGEDMRAAGYHW